MQLNILFAEICRFILNTFLTVAFLFNWIGFLLLMCACHTGKHIDSRFSIHFANINGFCFLKYVN